MLIRIVGVAAISAAFSYALAIGGCGQSVRSVTVTSTVAAHAPARRPTVPAKPPPPPVSLHRMVGQMVMAGMNGTSPDADLLTRIRAGEIGGVILYSDNIGSDLRQTIHELKAAAAAGRNPPLLISIDQEGGSVKRLADGPPDVAPPDIATPAVAESQGQRTGAYLRSFGINVNFAPVSDVPLTSASFEIGQGRGFRGTAAQIANLTDAFMKGEQAAGIAACAKHFPGVGALTVDTDFQLSRIDASSWELQAALTPFAQQIGDGVDMVMVASAVYPQLDPSGSPAGFSRRIVQGLLRGRYGYNGVVITDALDSPDALPGGIGDRAVYAARAGADIILYKPSEDGPAAYLSLLAAARSGALTRDRISASYARVVALKQKLATQG